MTVILGLNAYHADSSACVVVDGALVAAAEEERFCRIKHWAGFPRQAIRYCLKEAGTTLDQVDHVGLNRDPRANLGRKVRFAMRQRPALSLVADRARNARAWQAIEHELEGTCPGQSFNGTVVHVEHHLAHAASAHAASPFRDAVVLSVDGLGDFASAAWGLARQGELELDGKVYFPHSLGVFYQALTQFLGFPHYGDEYKVMGLAPYGRPAYVEQLGEVVRLRADGTYRLNLDYFRHHRERVGYRWRDTAPQMGALYSERLADLLGSARGADEPLEQRHRDLARSVQEVYERAFFHLLDGLHRRYRVDDLVLAGGCGMNSVANGKIRLRSGFRRSYVPPAPGDAGGAIGAAARVLAGQEGISRRLPMDHAYWGPRFSSADFADSIDRRAGELDREGCVVEPVDDLERLYGETARAIAAGQVVGWFQGRMEWGPRALGNRSILCDPRRADIKEILNRKIKRRESFRPFAPSILRQAVGAWFETDEDVPFMEKVLQVRDERRSEIPAVTHVDGTGRPQTVDERTSPQYHRLISAFRDLTGVPMVLNTSFNESEPIVHTPDEALDCFLRTRMDLLVLGEERVVRRSGGERAAGE